MFIWNVGFLSKTHSYLTYYSRRNTTNYNQQRRTSN